MDWPGVPGWQDQTRWMGWLDVSYFFLPVIDPYSCRRFFKWEFSILCRVPYYLQVRGLQPLKSNKHIYLRY